RRDGAPPRPRSRAWGSRQPTTTPRTSVPDPTSPARSAGQASVLVPQLQVAFGAAASGHLEHRGDRRVAGGDYGVLAGGQVDEPEHPVGPGGEGVDDVARGVQQRHPRVLDGPAAAAALGAAPHGAPGEIRVLAVPATLLRGGGPRR